MVTRSGAKKEASCEAKKKAYSGATELAAKLTLSLLRS